MISATAKKPLPPPPSSPAVTSGFNVRQVKPGETGFTVCLYGPAGCGKSSQATLAPGAVFLDLNHGLTGLQANIVDTDVKSFEDLRAVFKAVSSFVPEGGTFVIDTATDVAALMCEFLKIKYDKKSVKELGFDFFPCMAETFRLLLSDLEPAVRAKRNILFLAHEIAANYKNSQGDDYRILGPNLPHATTGSCQGELTSWCGHVLRIALAEPTVKVQVNDKGKIVGGRVMGASSARIITTDGTQSVTAKSRQIMVGGKSLRLPPQFSLDGPDDSSLWDGLKNPAIFDIPASA